ncbi:MAG: Na+/H+ antiporter subunit E [Defluviitaleaceae bacterium]|nr:Na+/H+ antiporter subunit E [Defluviitaleaceae bacterium]
MFTIMILTVVWVVLSGNLSVFNVIAGLVIGAVSYAFARRYMWPTKILMGVRVVKLLYYPFFLIGQMYISGFLVIKMIILGCRTEVVTIQTAIRNDFLRTVLCNSITMLPGSVMLEQEEEVLTVILLRNKDSEPFTHDDDVGYEVKGKPEAILLRAEA